MKPISKFSAIILLVLLSYSCKETADPGTAVKHYNTPLSRPAWVANEPTVYVGNWDAIPLFELRRGGVTDKQEENYYKEYTPETVRKLKDLGVTMAIIPFYKAFGYEAEKENIEQSKKLASLLKDQGIRVGVYVGCTFGYETFLAEKPEAEEWIVPDYMGRPVTYGEQVFRKLVYFQHPGYKEYIKGLLKIAIQDLKADLIHFDNPSLQASRPVFFHPLAIENFRTFLAEKYTPEVLKQKFGFSDMRHVEPPKTDRIQRTIDDPLIQEWTDFRCQQLADYYGEMEEYIRSLNPEVAVENNPHGLSGQNTMWDQSIDFPRLLSHTDFFWTEGEATGINNEGVLVSKIRTFKMARTLNNRVFTYTSDSKLEMAEAMAFNQQGMGMVGDLFAPDMLPEDQKNYIKFFHENFDIYRDAKNIADVAVLHNYESLAFNSDQPWVATFLFEQALIQAKVPFDIIFDDQLDDLGKYKVLVLADQECLSDDKLLLIKEFVKNGGGLISTGNTSMYTEWRRKRAEQGLQEFFAMNEDLMKGIVKNIAGKGRVVYIPAVISAIQKPPAAAMTGRYWKLPVNYLDLVEAVRWASGNDLSLEIEAPLSVTMELVRNESMNTILLHLVNFDTENTFKNIRVSMNVPPEKRISGINVISPDKEGIESLQFSMVENELEFSVPEIGIYSICVVKFQ